MLRVCGLASNEDALDSVVHHGPRDFDHRVLIDTGQVFLLVELVCHVVLVDGHRFAEDFRTDLGTELFEALVYISQDRLVVLHRGILTTFDFF